MIYVEWTVFKKFCQDRGSAMQFVDLISEYWLLAYAGPFGVETRIRKRSTEAADFETNHKHHANTPLAQDVVTRFEIDDKTLRCLCVFAQTNAQGIARIAFKVPDDGRYIAFGDGEFEERSFGDYISKIEVSDLDRMIAWSVAMQIDPSATEPVPDEVIIGMGNQIPGGPFPQYPCVGFFDEREINLDPPSRAGLILGGMTMTYRYGNAEVQPVGGFAWVDGLMYVVIEAKNAIAQKAQNTGFQASLDMAKKKATIT